MLHTDSASPVSSVSSSPTRDTAPAVADMQAGELVAAAEQLNVLASIAIPHVMQFLFPPMFEYFWQACCTKISNLAGDVPFPQLALGIPRGHGKTIFLKLLILYIILFTDRKFILVVCAKESLAESIIADVVDMLEHSNIRTLFGDWDADIKTDRQNKKVFHYRGRNIILLGAGTGTSFRGISEKFARPDVMIFDDSQTKDCATSAKQAQEYAEWFRGTAMKAKDPASCFFLYVGNMYPKLEIKPATPDRKAVYGCMLKNLQQLASWESITVGGLLADGSALWEELQSKQQLLQEYEDDCAAGQEGVFLAEVMNDDEAVDTNLFDETLVPDFPWTNDVLAQGECLIIDPSLGKKTSDDQPVGHMKVIDGQAVLWHLLPLEATHVSAPVLVRNCIDYCLEHNVPAIAIESYAYQASLGTWFEAVLDSDSGVYMDGMAQGIEGIEILLVSRGQASKNSAIRSMCKEVEQGDLWLHPQVRPHVYSEIRTFDMMKRDNKDNILDVASYCNLVANTFPQQIQVDILLHHGKSEHYQPDVLDIGMNY